MTDHNAHNNNKARIPVMPRPLLRSLLEAPLEDDTLRWMGDILMLGSSVAWASLAMGFLLVQISAQVELPWLESMIGSAVLISGWWAYPRQWVAQTPVLIQAVVVFVFVALTMTQPVSVTLGPLWIVAWACATASITTLAFGFVSSLFLVVSGSLVLNMLFQWSHPAAVHPTLGNLIGIAIASVVSLVTHGVCFQLTRASSSARQLERLRSDMLVAFATELSVPGNALHKLAEQRETDARSSALLGVIGHQLTALAAFLATESKSRAPKAQPTELFCLSDIVTLSTSQARRLAPMVDIETRITYGPNSDRLMLMPAREVALSVAYLTRDAILREDIRQIHVSSGVETLPDQTTYVRVLIKLESDPEAIPSRRASPAGHAANVAVRGLVYLIRATGGKLTMNPPDRRWQSAELWVPVQTNEYATRGDAVTAPDLPHALQDLEVLVVEDDELTRLLTARNLERMGAAVTVAANAAEALKAMAAREFDLVVADLHLPDTEGPALIADLRRQHCNVPIIVVTMSSGAADVEALVLAGADQLLGKPLQFERLQQTVVLLRMSGRIRTVA